MRTVDGIFNGKIISDKIEDEKYKRLIEKADEILFYLLDNLDDYDCEKQTELQYFLEAANEIEKKQAFLDGVRFGFNLKEAL